MRRTSHVANGAGGRGGRGAGQRAHAPIFGTHILTLGRTNRPAPRCPMGVLNEGEGGGSGAAGGGSGAAGPPGGDRKSTRLNSSHVAISYAVFCLKKKQQR